MGWQQEQKAAPTQTKNEYEKNLTGGQYVCHLTEEVLSPNLASQQLSSYLT